MNGTFLQTKPAKKKTKPPPKPHPKFEVGDRVKIVSEPQYETTDRVGWNVEGLMDKYWETRRSSLRLMTSKSGRKSAKTTAAFIGRSIG